MKLARIANRGALLLVIGAAAAATACGSSNTGPSGGGPGGGGGSTCRTYPTAATVTTTSANQTITAQLTGAFDTSTNRSTVTTAFANGNPCTSSVSSYRSKDDLSTRSG